MAFRQRLCHFAIRRQQLGRTRAVRFHPRDGSRRRNQKATTHLGYEWGGHGLLADGADLWVRAVDGLRACGELAPATAVGNADGWAGAWYALSAQHRMWPALGASRRPWARAALMSCRAPSTTGRRRSGRSAAGCRPGSRPSWCGDSHRLLKGGRERGQGFDGFADVAVGSGQSGAEPRCRLGQGAAEAKAGRNEQGLPPAGQPPPPPPDPPRRDELSPQQFER